MANKNPMFCFKPGDDIVWTGKVIYGGVTDFTGYTLRAHFRAKDPRTGKPGNLLAAAQIAWLDLAQGLFSLKVSKTDTLKWPVDILVLLDISLMNPQGMLVRTETVTFQTTSGVTLPQ